MLDNDIQSIRNLHPKKFFILWLLGNFCPYSCSYCPAIFHSGSIPYQDINDVIRTMNSLPEGSIVFSGGEPTYHPEFEKILDNKPAHLKIGVISNGARPQSFWERIKDDLDFAILTFHAEFAKLDRFVDTCTALDKTLIRINLTMIPEKWDECSNAYDAFIKNGFPVSPKPLVENFGFKSSSIIDRYTDEQRNWIIEKNESSTTAKYIGLYDKDGVIVRKTNPAEMISADETNFKGWTCHTPEKFIGIDPDGQMYDTSCAQRRLIGNIKTGFTVSTTPMICRQNFCWCHSDIDGSKERPI
jgi:MoaA/NifB/PqqE/SkfB family radical SAM enzyme